MYIGGKLLEREYEILYDPCASILSFICKNMDQRRQNHPCIVLPKFPHPKKKTWKELSEYLIQVDET